MDQSPVTTHPAQQHQLQTTIRRGTSTTSASHMRTFFNLYTIIIIDHTNFYSNFKIRISKLNLILIKIPCL